MELIVQPIEKAQPIVFNYAELKNEIQSKCAEYKNLIYSNEQIDIAKKDRSALNSLKKALNEERIRREREWLEPFETFKEQIRELCNLIDEPVQLIDKQIKEVEEQEKSEKRDKCVELFGNIEHPDWLKYEQIQDSKWYNKTTSGKAINDEIAEKVKKINADISVLSELEYSFEAIEEYKRTLDLSVAMNEGKRQAEIQARKKATTPEIPFSETEPIENAPDEEAGKESRVWLSFKAYLSMSEALELKAFLNAMEIQYEAIKEDK